MTLQIRPILCNAGYMDNYAYLITDEITNTSAIVDAAEEIAIVNFCRAQNITPQYILTTHHHKDHTNANLALKKRFQAQIIGSAAEAEKIPGLDIALSDGDTFNLGNSKAKVILAPGHTDGHLLWYFSKDKALFTGDVLFNLCIGGLFEGTMRQMWQSLQKIKALPDDVRFYPGHEYTGASLNYLAASQNEPEIQQYLQFLETCRKNNLPPVGIPLNLEKKCNPYLKIASETDFINKMS